MFGRVRARRTAPTASLEIDEQAVKPWGPYAGHKAEGDQLPCESSRSYGDASEPHHQHYSLQDRYRGLDACLECLAERTVDRLALLILGGRKLSRGQSALEKME